ncbi:two pore domain potassium channel family protein [Macrococcus bovicus]|uniref:Two pore domain potassium channel family protein n=1 Tax=Macrococcus bovicus TaxID=69968 RepID=A0A4R6C137_9STAP|nr:two pore domain potassium channel family protein [Macrococcus bovicus]TDM14925.1 two pore domain potassium channel family protein [Macrococcus bovicus]
MISLLIALRRLVTSLWHVVKQPISKALILTLAFILLGSTIYLTNVNHLSLFDAFYTSIVILIPSSLSVDYHPETVMDKVFMMIYLLTGSGTMLTTLVVIAQAMFTKKQRNSGVYNRREK